MQLFLTTVLCVATTFAAQTGITCPKCTNPYDHTSCTQTQKCHNSHDVCEMQVHLADNNRLSYVCHNSHACTNHEAHACSIDNHEMCAYCCNSVDACKAQRDQVFANLPTTQAPTTMAPGATTMAPGATTMAPGATTMAPGATTMAPGATTMAPGATTMAPAGTTMDPMATTMPSASNVSPNKCVQCGGVISDCSAVDLLLQPPSECPSDKPYCFNRIVHSFTDTHIVKGCMDQQTCKSEWWDATSPKAECQTVDLSDSSSLDCTFCCQGDGCNKDTKPNDTLLVQFGP